ncbi:MAG: hypothetical protein SO008_06945 [Bacteroidaceae bacterium]|nr:hypothetical protein [Bacteroidaceae bacterium]
MLSWRLRYEQGLDGTVKSRRVDGNGSRSWLFHPREHEDKIFASTCMIALPHMLWQSFPVQDRSTSSAV